MTTTSTRSRTTGSRTTIKSRAPSVAGGTNSSASSSSTNRHPRYSSAAIATGAVTAVVAAAAGAFFFSRRDRTSLENGETITNKVKGSFADARARIKDLVSSDASSSDQRSQHDIAEEALMLKESGGSGSSFDEVSKRQNKTGAIAY